MTDKSWLKYLRQEHLFDFKDKKENVEQHMLYMLARTQSMFKWSGLPDTIPCYMLEEYLQINGFCAVTQVDGELYAFCGGLGGEQDAYYQPTICTVANPYLQFNAELKIGTDCVLIRNDCFMIGLTPMFNKYASQLTENELSMYMATVNTRIQSAISAADDSTKESAEHFLDDLVKGKLGVIADNAFLDSLKTLPLSTSANTNVLGDLIEQEQYLKASWYNELGLNANYNMKREALNSAESSINDDILFPLVDEMLKQRQVAAELINEKYGTDISVELSSSWDDNKQEEEAELESLEESGDAGETEEDGEETSEDELKEGDGDDTEETTGDGD